MIKLNDFRLVKKVLSTSGPEVQRLLLASSISGGLLFALELGFVFIIQLFLVSIGLVKYDQSNLPPWLPHSLSFVIILFVLYGIFRTLSFGLNIYLSGAVKHHFNYIQRKKILYFGLFKKSSLSTHEIVSAFSERVNEASSCLALISMFLSTIVSATLILFYGINSTPKEMITGIGLMALFLIPFYYIDASIQKKGVSVVEQWNSVNKVLIQSLKQIFFLNIHGLEQNEFQKGSTYLQNYKKSYLDYYLLSAIKQSAPIGLGMIIISLISYLSLEYYNTKSSTLIGFVYLFIRFSQSISVLNGIVNNFSYQKKGLEYLVRLNENEIGNPSFNLLKSSNDHQRLLIHNIKFKNVSFSYLNDPVLINIHFTLNKGNIFVVRGESGSGKSTLLSLILGILKPTHGEILMNDVSLSIYTEKLRKEIGYVASEPYIVSGTIKENVLYGHPRIQEVTDDMIWSILDQLELGEIIKLLPLKLDESLVERMQLSTGQIQRLSLARAFLRNSQLFVLDEATANLDKTTEELVIKLILQRKDTCITIISTHSDSFDKISSQQLKMNKIIL